MIIEIKGNIPGPVYEINPHHDLYITHHHHAIAPRRVEVTLGAVHVFMSDEEADGFGRNLQALSGYPRTADQLGMAQALLVDSFPVSGVKADKIGRALQEVIGYLMAQRAAQGAGT